MNDNIKAGGDIHAGDGGYSIGTQEKYDEFVKGRNQSLGKIRIKELKEQAMEWVPNQVDPNTKIKLLNAEKFAELIVRECMKESMDEIIDDAEIAQEKDPLSREYLKGNNQGIVDAVIRFRNHFGVEE
jgi:hypothetical protein